MNYMNAIYISSTKHLINLSQAFTKYFHALEENGRKNELKGNTKYFN